VKIAPVKIVIVGCGIVGATLAYELSRDAGWDVQVLEGRSHPAKGSTGAALGLLMGVISQKVKGRAWRWREEGLRYYQRMLPELAALDLPVPHNDQGLLKLVSESADLAKWQSLVDIRVQQGWPLAIWSAVEILDRFPWLQISDQTSAIYSAADWQVNPAELTRSLVAAAERQGVRFCWDTAVVQITDGGVETERGFVEADRVIITAGLGSSTLTAQSEQPLELMPILGQAIHYRLSDFPDFHPVVTSNDVHAVPLGGGEYWVGATVEFPVEFPGDFSVGTEVAVPSAESFADLQRQSLGNLQRSANEFFPALATAEILGTWSGLRPRPVGRPAPVVEKLAGYQNVLVATGHYRNGVLLAPATAQMVQELLLEAFR
jgi:glycine/D-amino acid oxidase-like deaminating enzyme